MSSGPSRNHLASESSPYLLLHAGNPVDWFPWGPEAFEKARVEEKPVFLSVGYSTCYWCHVMERESFSSEEIARLLNADFVSIKLDREERPDLDEYFMTATQLLTHQGGWPNSLFLTPEGKPFFAGTYFPPIDARGRPGFPRILASVKEAWRGRREAVLEQAEALVGAIRETLSGGGERVLPGPGVVKSAQAILARNFDPVFGGFSRAPKFPSPSNLFFLLGRSLAGDADARQMLVVTLDRMARGGIQDQLAGGFHRYSTDAEWLVPHFEKMLYDNATLSVLFAEASTLAPEMGFDRVSRRTLDFVLGRLRSSEGPFLSAIDAETDGDEGAYYVWSARDLEEILSKEERDFLAPIWGFDGRPNFEGGRYVLHLPEGIPESARRLGMSEAALLGRLEPLRLRLLEARGKRPHPLIDDKILTDWNGLMISSMARGSQILGEPRYLSAASEAAEFLLGKLKDSSGHLLHVYRGKAKVPAVLDDYAFLVSGLLRLYEATTEGKWLSEATRLTAEQEGRLGDSEGGFFATGENAGLPFRSKAATDGALPSGNGVSTLNLLDLARITGDAEYTRKAGRALEAFGSQILSFPIGHATLVQAVARLSPVSDPSVASKSRVLKVEGTLLAAKAGWTPFTLDIEIQEGWHVNANAVGLPTLVATEVREGEGRIRNVVYPEGEVLGHLPTGEAVLVYRGHVQIRGEIDIAEDASLSLIYQPCDESRCLAPVTEEITLK